MFGGGLPALRPAPDIAAMVLPGWPRGVPAGTRPAGTLAQRPAG